MEQSKYALPHELQSFRMHELRNVVLNTHQTLTDQGFPDELFGLLFLTRGIEQVEELLGYPAEDLRHLSEAILWEVAALLQRVRPQQQVTTDKAAGYVNVF